jgi:hypothetical protein
VWGYFGENPIYINHWRVLGLRPENKVWELIQRGDFPDSTETVIPVKNRYIRLRIAADSTANWLGIFEVEVFGFSLNRRRTAIRTVNVGSPDGVASNEARQVPRKPNQQLRVEESSGRTPAQQSW